jgi:diguanylate cyclase (GGDEF)-like protein
MQARRHAANPDNAAASTDETASGPRQSWLARKGWSVRTLLATALIAVVGIGASLALALAWRSNIRNRDDQVFRTSAANLTATLGSTLDRDLDLTRTMSAIVSMNPRIDESQLLSWSRQLRLGPRSAGGQLIFFVREIPRRELGEYLRVAERDPAFRRLTNGQSQVVPAGARSHYCLVQSFLDTGNTHSSLPPLIDLCAPTLPGIGRSPYAALLQEMAETGQVQVVPEPGVDASIIVTGVAVYRPQASLKSRSQRRAALLGWVGSSFDATSVIHTAMAEEKSLEVALYHQNPGAPMRLLSRVGAVQAHSLSYTRPLAGEDAWWVRVSASAAAFSANSQGLVVLGCGLLVTLLVCLLYLVLNRSRRRAMELVDEKTDQLRHQALHDPLTGLPNRVLVIDRAEQVLSRARRLGMPAVALLIDLDSFKQLNDRYGHDAGDFLLKVVATRLRAALRDGDTVGRIDADQFVALLEPGSLDATPELVAERVLEVLRQPIEMPAPAGTSVLLTASVGVAMGQRAFGSDLLRDADVALYEAKRGGGDRYVLFESAMHVSAQDRLLRQMDLREALEREEFFLLYQPMVDLPSERIIGVEALIRWRHPSRGVLSPDRFIPLAEESGVIVAIGRWVLRSACAQAAAWRKAGHTLTVAVNVSARQLERDELVDEVAEALADFALEPESLTLEITETALMQDAEVTARLLEQLKLLGVKIAVDDFGSGYSSLAYLRQFPVDALKIDRAFVSDLESSAESRVLAHTLIELGKTLGLQTVAEGIEQPRQLDLLRDESCDMGQGFLFAGPLEPAALVGLLLARTSERYTVR